MPIAALRPAAPAPAPARSSNRRSVLEDQARATLGLPEEAPTPLPQHLSSEDVEALDQIDPEARDMALAVLGCVEQAAARVRAMDAKVVSNLAIAEQKTQQVAFSQKLLLRRADDGTMTPADVARAQASIADQVKATAMDSASIGLDSLSADTAQLVAIAGSAQKSLREALPPSLPGFSPLAQAVDSVANLIGTSAGSLASSAIVCRSLYNTSEIGRLQLGIDKSQELSATYSKDERQAPKPMGV